MNKLRDFSLVHFSVDHSRRVAAVTLFITLAGLLRILSFSFIPAMFTFVKEGSWLSYARAYDIYVTTNFA